MAATPKGPQKVRVEFNLDRPTHDDFVRACDKKGYAPVVVLEKLMKKYAETGQF